jgi:hypothetical protein
VRALRKDDQEKHALRAVRGDLEQQEAQRSMADTISGWDVARRCRATSEAADAAAGRLQGAAAVTPEKERPFIPPPRIGDLLKIAAYAWAVYSVLCFVIDRLL